MNPAEYPGDEDDGEIGTLPLSLDQDRATAYVKHVCGAKGQSDEPAFDESEYVRYLTVGRHKPVLPARRPSVSGDRLDEVL
jgi:hypothetical protein